MQKGHPHSDEAKEKMRRAHAVRKNKIARIDAIDKLRAHPNDPVAYARLAALLEEHEALEAAAPLEEAIVKVMRDVQPTRGGRNELFDRLTEAEADIAKRKEARKETIFE